MGNQTQPGPAQRRRSRELRARITYMVSPASVPCSHSVLSTSLFPLCISTLLFSLGRLINSYLAHDGMSCHDLCQVPLLTKSCSAAQFQIPTSPASSGAEHLHLEGRVVKWIKSELCVKAVRREGSCENR